MMAREKVLDKFKSEWPSEGNIEFNNASMRYRPNLAPSIKNLNFKV
jgi:ABC-type bacteriocin/lantibiotic exporter with double-glycine peptidase domain